MSSSTALVIEHLVFSPLVFILPVFIILLIRPAKGQKGRWSRRTKWFAFFWGLLFLMSSSWFFQLVSWPLKQWTPESKKVKADVIVVATAGVHESGAPSPGSTIRAHAAATLYLEGWAPLVLVTGGVTHPYSSHVDTKGMHIILRGMGVPNDHILIEDRSTDTYTNSTKSQKILQAHNLKTVLLVTHDYHLLRLYLVFKKLGLEIYPYAANTSFKKDVPWWKTFEWENYNRLRTYAHEYVGLLVYKLLGKI